MVAGNTAGTGDVNGPSGSADGELPVFSGTTGKVIRRYTGITGFPKVQQNAALAVQSQILAPDLSPDVIHAQTQKTTDLVDADEFLVWDSTVSALRRLASSKVRHLPGEVVQTVYMEQAAEITTVLEISPPFTNIQGIEFLTAALTPKYADSKVLVTARGGFGLFASAIIPCSALFLLCITDSSAPVRSAIYESSTGDGKLMDWSLSFMHTPGAGSKIYSIRAASATSAYDVNLAINGYTYVASGYNMSSTLVLQEIKQ